MSSEGHSAEIICPQCRERVAPFSPYPYLTINLCQRCGLSWLDPGELAIFLQKPSDLPPCAKPVSEVPSSLNCPNCPQTTLFAWSAGQVDMMRCRACLGILISLKEAQSLKKLFPSTLETKVKRLRRTKDVLHSSKTFDSPLADILGLPLSILLASWLAYSPGFLLLTWMVTIFFHELGHALTAWLAGFFAIPTPFAFTPISNERHSLVIAFFVLLWSAGLMAALRSKSRILASLFVILLGAQLCLSFQLTSEQAREWVIASGLGLEMVFAALLIGAFHYRLPLPLRWDFWRFPALCLGAIIYSHSIMLWFKIKQGKAAIPWGSAVGEASDGDLNRLREVWGWSDAIILEFYSQLAQLCLLWIVLHYLLAFPSRWKAFKKQRSNAQE